MRKATRMINAIEETIITAIAIGWMEVVFCDSEVVSSAAVLELVFLELVFRRLVVVLVMYVTPILRRNVRSKDVVVSSSTV
jgi:hypothetical protein